MLNCFESSCLYFLRSVPFRVKFCNFIQTREHKEDKYIQTMSIIKMTEVLGKISIILSVFDGWVGCFLVLLGRHNIYC